MNYAWTKLLFAGASPKTILASGNATTDVIYLGENAEISSLAFKATGTAPNIKIEVVPQMGTLDAAMPGHADDYTDVVASSSASFASAMANALYAFTPILTLPPATGYAFKITNLNGAASVVVTIHARRAVETD